MKPAILCLVASLCLTSDQDRRHLGKIAWELDPAGGLAKARSQNRNALLYFTADW